MAAPAFLVPEPNAARLADPALREALLRYARRRLPPGEVEDLVQNTLTDALTADSAPNDAADFQRWVHGIARPQRLPTCTAAAGDYPCWNRSSTRSSNDPGPATGELAQWIEKELPKTDGAHATLHWLLRESDGESLDEIARDAALPAPRVRQRVSRLRRHLHSRWLALGAAGLALLLSAAAVLHALRKPEPPAPVIARDTAPSAQPPSVTPAPALSAPAASALPLTKSAPKLKLAPRRKAAPKQLKGVPSSNAHPKPVPNSLDQKSKSNFDDMKLQKQD